MNQRNTEQIDTIEPTAAQPLSWAGVFAALWGSLGVLALLTHALWRLTPLAIEPIAQSMMNPFHWTLYIAWSLLNAYMEGYRGFQKSFSPMVAERALGLARNPTLLHSVLAPFYCMALFAAPRKRKIISWMVIVMVVALILIIRQLSQPWRGIVDVGVVVGLSWGSLSIVYCLFQTFKAHSSQVAMAASLE